ncbi:MAG: glycoside hydrolase family 2 TIM barrel-domain containing protein, partial [Paracoccus sp. (in: a-proteobacteria)]|nr:glycoside hydrolase family 2 TIM barrel-domain containing protein [Paracoccus sp. (in: a-proteobacteria)]
MRTVTKLNHGWTFAEGHGDPAALLAGAAVILPHNAVDLPLTYFDETAFQRPFTYQRAIAWDDAWAGRRVQLRFDGAMADARVWVNGIQVAAHPDGYTPFIADLTEHLRSENNLVTVQIDGSENPAIPPFGAQIDYLTYAGLYRDVWLMVLPERHLTNARILTPDALAKEKTVIIRPRLAAPGPVRARLLDGTREIAATEGDGDLTLSGLTGLGLWSTDDPRLYTVELTLPDSGDVTLHRFGFRTAEWTPQGFELNGRPMKLRGLNRHQSWAHQGYAAGRHAQERDAEILRHDLGCNIVRTSHYPQSTWFLDRCDEIGLLVFEEIPGWQHIGDATWQDRSLDNLRAMITRDWNHPSIVIWGVRINESPDNHDFYTRTNALARDLDPTRATGGVRYMTDSEMLEDVYTMNDFILDESERPTVNHPRTALRAPAQVTGLQAPVPYLVTEYSGHMFPTKAGDPELRQMEHVIRHLE